MTKQHIDRLKELVLTSADLTEPIDYFLQHVSTDAEIVRASQLVQQIRRNSPIVNEVPGGTGASE
jgi:hypothetical protein